MKVQSLYILLLECWAAWPEILNRCLKFECWISSFSFHNLRCLYSSLCSIFFFAVSSYCWCCCVPVFFFLVETTSVSACPLSENSEPHRSHNDTGHKASSVRFIHILPAACPSGTTVMGTANMEQKWDESGKEMEAKVQNGVGILVKMFYSMWCCCEYRYFYKGWMWSPWKKSNVCIFYFIKNIVVYC